jgi:dimethylamine/trimethylamine dehydrogenase
LRTGLTVTAHTNGTTNGTDAYGDPFTIDADDLVLVTHQVPDDSLYVELLERDLSAAGIASVHLIGDALAPRWISEAVFDGHRLAREIDLPTPDFPASMRREPLA